MLSLLKNALGRYCRQKLRAAGAAVFSPQPRLKPVFPVNQIALYRIFVL